MRFKAFFVLCFSLMVLTLPMSAIAISLEDAARRAAQQNNAKVLSAKTIKRGNKRIHEIKLLTKKGVVKTVRIPENSN